MCLYLHGPLPFAVGAVTWTRELLLHSVGHTGVNTDSCVCYCCLPPEVLKCPGPPLRPQWLAFPRGAQIRCIVVILGSYPGPELNCKD